MARIGRALVSVSDKRGLERLARALVAAGVEILSTGGTAKALADWGIPVTAVSDYTGSPEILDGRVKTLHPEDPRRHPRHARRGEPPRADGAARHRPDRHGGGEPLPVRAGDGARRRPRFAEAIENIDIGGPSMVRSAAKNHADVTVARRPRRLRGRDRASSSATARCRPATNRRLAAEGVRDHRALRRRHRRLPGRRGRATGPFGADRAPRRRQGAGPALRRESRTSAPRSIATRRRSTSRRSRARASCRGRSCRSTTSSTPTRRSSW